MNAFIRGLGLALRAARRAAGERRHQGAGHHVRLGLAGNGTRRRQGERLHGHQSAAGRAPRRCQAQPRGPGPHRPTSSSRRAPSSSSAGCPCCCRNPAIRKSSQARPAISKSPRRCGLLDIPTAVDRSMGDVHALGNPHVQLDPRNIATAAKALSARLAQVDASNAAFYQQRGADFQARWQQAMTRWSDAGSDAQGRSGRRHPQGPDLPGPLARHEGTRRHRTQARRAAERGVSRGSRGQARCHAAAE